MLKPPWILPLPDSDVVTLQEVTEPDCESLTRLALASKQYWGYSDDFMQSCYAELAVSPEKLARREYCYKKALSGGDIVGFYCLQKLSAGKFEVEALFVSPEQIGKGVGKLLWLDLLSTVTELGATQLLIASDPNAEAFYLSMGAVKAGDIASGSIPGRSLPLLVVNL